MREYIIPSLLLLPARSSKGVHAMRGITIFLLVLLIIAALVTLSPAVKTPAQVTALLTVAQPVAGHQSESRTPARCYCVTGAPSVSASFINRVLAYYGSPASGLGSSLYALGVQYGINPVYALAFFMHESGLGIAGMARSTLSPGNIRCSAGYRCINGFRAYASWSAGFEDWFRLIRYLYVDQWHKDTVEQIVPTYAPSGDHNNVAAYIAAIETAVGKWDSGRIEVAG